MVRTRILAISNDPLLLAFFKRHLGGGDYDISVGTDTAGIQEIMENLRPDVVLLDIMMPSLDGIEVCLRLRQWCQVPIIMLSTWGAGDGKVRGLNLGAEGYLTEPFGIDELKSRIREASGRSRFQQYLDREKSWAA